MKNLSLIFCFVFSLTNCGGSKKPVELVINSDDTMRFDQRELRVPENSRVTLTLNHTGKIDKTSMGHNVVIIRKDVDLVEFAIDAVQARDNEYIPKDSRAIAYTKMIGGGESTRITFDAPAKGEYEFLCTFPGHYSVMRGLFIVE